MKALKRGMLISIEGIDGSGKSTLIQQLTQKLVDEHFPLVVTKEPGGTLLGKQLRTLLQERTFTIVPKAEYLLFAADRAQHFEELIIPSLKANKLIISDRMADSSLVYQGFGRGLDLGMMQTINQWAMDGFKPDLTLYVQISVETALERLKQRKQLSVFDKEKETFFAKLVEGFETIFRNRPDVIYLDGQQTPANITQQAYAAILTRMTTNNLL
ncbi:MAG TPA: dTMP kinase [Candidatus Babeliales bacterium]|nr:dTMP kinase [Candidatus Babeliales bacterium]